MNQGQLRGGEAARARAGVIGSMVIFGTIGIFRRYIPLPSSVIAMMRGMIGAAFLLALTLLRGRKLDGAAIRRCLPALCASGAMLGFNWILLFEAYRYTSVATATLCYYMAPVLVILASPVLFGERLGARKIACVIAASAGMALVSGVLEAGFTGLAELRGVAFGLGAAVLYASVVLVNKRVDGVGGNDRTIMQLSLAAAVLIPYTLATEDFSAIAVTPLSAGMLLLVGVVHTGVAYAMYFGSMKAVSAQSAAIMSYIDPAVAIVLSVTVLREPLSVTSLAGAVLVLGAAMISELPEREKK